MSLRLLAGQVPLLKYQRSTAALISALFWLLALVLAVELETEMRGMTTTAMMPRMVTTARSSSSEKPRRLRRVFIGLTFRGNDRAVFSCSDASWHSACRLS